MNDSGYCVKLISSPLLSAVRRFVPVFAFSLAALILLAPASQAEVSARSAKKNRAVSLRVVKTTPRAGDGLIPVETVFSAEFSDDLDPATVCDRFVSLSEKNSPVKAEIAYRKTLRRVDVRPLKKLKFDAEYRLVFKSGLSSRSGVRLPTAVMYQFFTIPSPEKPPIKVISTSPKGGAELIDEKPVISAVFDQNAEFVSGEDLGEYMALFEGDKRIPSAVSYKTASRRLELRPQVALRGGAEYRAVVSRKLRGANGKCMAETFLWNFRTAKIVFFLKYSYPDSSRKHINSYDRIILGFSEGINQSCEFENFIKVEDERGTAIPGRFQPFGTSSVIFIPEYAFYPGDYAVVVSGDFTSFHGNPLTRAVRIAFSVGSDDFNSGERYDEK